jgi:hypothetical protein
MPMRLGFSNPTYIKSGHYVCDACHKLQDLFRLLAKVF